MSTPDAQEDSPITQGQHTEAFIAEHRLPPWTRSYFDLGISAGTVDKRPGILQLIRDAEQQKPAAIVFYKLDRAFRNSTEQAVALRAFKRANVQIWKVRDPNISGPTGELVDTVLGGVNQFERQLGGLRIRDHNEAMAQRGEWAGGRPPYGYRYRQSVREQHGRRRTTIEQGGLERDPVEWPIARQVFDWALQGYRKMEITELANDAGYRRREGGAWDANAVTKLLANRTYAGYVSYSAERRVKPRDGRKWDNTTWYPGIHEPLVTLEEWMRVQQTANSKLGQRRPNRHPRAELAGLIRCRICGGPVCSMGRDPVDGYYYGCQPGSQGSAGHPMWTRAPWVIHMALSHLLDQVAAQLPATPAPQTGDGGRAKLERELSGLQNQRRRMRDLYKAGEYNDDMDAYQRDTRQLDARIELAREALARSAPRQDDIGALWAQLRGWEHDYLNAGNNIRERQRVWAAYVERIEMDQLHMTVTLRDLGPEVAREWAVDLPPVRTRRPGSKCGTGVVGERAVGRSRAYLARDSVAIRPV